MICAVASIWIRGSSVGGNCSQTRNREGPHSAGFPADSVSICELKSDVNSAFVQDIVRSFHMSKTVNNSGKSCAKAVRATFSASPDCAQAIVDAQDSAHIARTNAGVSERNI